MDAILYLIIDEYEVDFIRNLWILMRAEPSRKVDFPTNQNNSTRSIKNSPRGISKCVRRISRK
jgi:hypothetical protein